MAKRFVPFVCLNCDDEILLPTLPKLYCSVGCSQEAELIRYARRTEKDGRANQPDVMEAIQIRLAHVMAGGYQKRERYIPLDVRLTVRSRDHGQCCLCGQPGTEIDHIEGASRRLENLQPLCHACHNEKTLASVVYVYPGDEGYEVLKAKHADFWRRVDAKRPVRMCDDEENWKNVYGTLMAECRQSLNKKTTDARKAKR